MANKMCRRTCDGRSTGKLVPRSCRFWGKGIGAQLEMQAKQGHNRGVEEEQEVKDCSAENLRHQV